MKQNRLIYFVLGVLILALCLVTYKLYNKIQRLEYALVEYRDEAPTSKGVASLYQSYAMKQAHDIIDANEHHIICLGNSITLHKYKDSIGWKSEWGMAASRESNDYCHVLERMMREKNENTTVTPLNISTWESNLALNMDSLLSNKLQGKDVIIIRLGENVKDKQAFKVAITNLVRYCLTKTQHVYITGCFWRDDAKESAIINAAQQCRIKYIPIFWLSCLYKDEVYPKEGDTLRDIHNKLYQIEGDFITSHPNDEGMKRIAQTIYDNL